MPVGSALRAMMGAANAAPLFDDEPWLVNVHVFMTPISHVNFNSNSAGNTNNLYSALRISSGAQNDEINFEVLLGAGTWTFELIHEKNTNVGIYSVQLDGVEKGTIDGYAASQTRDVRSQITSITVATTDVYTLKLKMATKNGSSSSYLGAINHIQFKRTA